MAYCRGLVVCETPGHSTREGYTKMVFPKCEGCSSAVVVVKQCRWKPAISVLSFIEPFLKLAGNRLPWAMALKTKQRGGYPGYYRAVGGKI